MQTNALAYRAEGSAQWALLAVLMVALATLIAVAPAFAGADTTVAGDINGSAGKLAALASLGYGIVRMATAGWSLGHVGVPITVGVAAGIGGPIVQSSVTALI